MQSGATVNLKAEWVLPMSGPPLRNAVVTLRNGRIAAVSTDEPDTGRVLDYGKAIIMPGFINLHTHLDYSALRLFDTSSQLFSWISGLVGRSLKWTPEEWLMSATRGAQEVLLSGTTCVADSSLTGSAAMAIARAGLRGVVALELFGLDPLQSENFWTAWLERFEKLEQAADEVFQAALAGNRLKLTVSPHTPYSVNPVLWRKAADWCEHRKSLLLTHVAETIQECEWIAQDNAEVYAFLAERSSPSVLQQLKALGWRGTGRTPVQYLSELDLLNDNVLAAHAVHVTEDDIATLAGKGVKVAHCPRSNARLKAGRAPFSTLARAGVQAGFGTDSAASCDDLDIRREALFAWNLHRATDPEFPEAAEQFVRRLTLGAAEILGWAGDIGSLEAGKAADIVVLQIDESAQPAIDHPYDLVLFEGSQVRDVFVAGSRVVKDRKIVTAVQSGS